MTRLNNTLLLILFGFAAALSISSPAAAAPGLLDAIKDGRFNLGLRYRYEHVADDLQPAGTPLKDANASTLRTTLSYESGAYRGLSVLLEAEQISRIFSGDFNEGHGLPSEYATVVDPDGTELNQGYLRYLANDNIELKAGRQIITYRKKPFHRFIGTILWRQNWQTFDAVSLKFDGLSGTDISYAWSWNVNRIFGDDAPEPLSDFEGNAHFINIQNRTFGLANIEAYAYLLDFDNAARFSSKTFGLRFSGEYVVSETFSSFYALEYADQSDHGNFPGDYDADYQLAELGFKYVRGGTLKSLMLKANYERLGGDGTTNGAFVTILGTNHAFQGAADRFLITPDDGIRDYYLTGVAVLFGFKLVAGYHILESDHLDYRYGEELDLELQRKFGEHYAAGLKFADYNADANATNQLRNSAQAADVRKFWFYVTANF